MSQPLGASSAACPGRNLCRTADRFSISRLRRVVVLAEPDSARRHNLTW